MINSKKTKLKRIGIDARFYGPSGKGLGRYTKEIVDRLLKLDQENEYVIFLVQENYDLFKTDNFYQPQRIKKVLLKIHWYGFKEQFLFPFFIWREKLDLMHFPHFNVPIFCPAKFIVTIHDLILLKFPTDRATTLGPIAYAIKNFFYKTVILLAVKRSQQILTVSQFTKNDIIRQFKILPEKILITYQGVADLSIKTTVRIKAEEILIKYKIQQPFLLYVGNAYPHKNLENLIKIFSYLNKEQSNLNLVLVGKEDYFYYRLKNFARNYKAKIVFPGYVPDEDLEIFYKKALAYVFPSKYEGFGLPPLEAMAAGLPVVSSDKTCLPEILGQSALYFNPYDETDMLEKIKLIIKDENLRQALIAKGYEQIKKYSWQDCAVKTLEVYNIIISHK